MPLVLRVAVHRGYHDLLGVDQLLSIAPVPRVNNTRPTIASVCVLCLITL